MKPVKPIGTFYEEVYSANIKLFCPATDQTIADYLHRHYGVDIEDCDAGHFSGKCAQVEDDEGRCEHLIFLREWDTTPHCMSVLAHECFHAVEQIMEARDLPHNDHTSEAWAYLHDSIVRRCAKILGKKKRKPIK